MSESLNPPTTLSTADLELGAMLELTFPGRDLVEAAVQLAVGELQAQRPKQAIPYLDWALRMKSRHPAALLNRAVARQCLGDSAAALSDLNRALEIDANYFLAHQNRGRLHDARREYEAALADFTAALALAPNAQAQATCLFDRGTAQQSLGNLAAALKDYTAALQHNPRHELALGNRAGVLLSQGDFVGALADANRLVELAEDDATSYFNRGVIHYEAKSWEAALADFSRAIELSPQLAPAWGYRGLAHLILKQTEKGRQDFAACRRLSPRTADDFEKAAKSRGLVM